MVTAVRGAWRRPTVAPWSPMNGAGASPTTRSTRCTPRHSGPPLAADPAGAHGPV